MKSGFDRIGFTVTVAQAKRSCLDKRRYDSRNHARDAAAKNRTLFPGSPDQRPYRCTLCGDWHLTSQRHDARDKGKSPAKAGKPERAEQQCERLPEEG